MAVYLTGDLHGSYDISKLNTTFFPQQKELTKEDYVIILGDFGLLWCQEESAEERNWLNWLEEKPFTTLFLDGNHENYDRFKEYPVEEWKGGNVQFIRPHIIHLMRGQVYDIEGHSFFVMGGASSHDIQDGILEQDDRRIKQWYADMNKRFRINRLSWWEEEMPNSAEFALGMRNIASRNNKVDYILSHSPSSSELYLMGGVGLYKTDTLTEYLDEVMAITDFKRHYFGHMHINSQVSRNAICLYERIERII